jgi:nucleoside-diphosphate-sugar epimerase
MTVSSSVLVTGAAGFVGSHVVRALEKRGLPVVGIDVARADGATSSTLYAVDLTSPGELEEILRKHRVRRVVHLASVLSTASKQDPQRATAVNISGTLALLEASRKCGVERVVYASSNSVYGSKDLNTRISEEDPASAEDLYGAGKRYVEFLGEAYSRNLGLHFLALRIATVLGGALRTTASAWRGEIFEPFDANQEVEIAIPYRAEQVLALVYVEDVAEMTAQLLLAKSPAHTIYNAHCEQWSMAKLKQEIELRNANVRVLLGSATASGFPAVVNSQRFVREFRYRPVPLAMRLREVSPASPKN